MRHSKEIKDHLHSLKNFDGCKSLIVVIRITLVERKFVVQGGGRCKAYVCPDFSKNNNYKTEVADEKEVLVWRAGLFGGGRFFLWNARAGEGKCSR